MQFQFFKIPVDYPTEEADALNTFLRTVKIVKIEKNFVTTSTESFWAISVTYILQQTNNSQGKAKAEIDYKARLGDELFEVFNQLRAFRKEVAAKEAIPVYAVFNNDELAGIASLKELSIEKMKKVKGIGEQKIKKYGKFFLEKIKKINESKIKNPQNTEPEINETSQSLDELDLRFG